MSRRPPRTRQEALRDFRTDQILAAAAAVFGDLGFAEASIDRIAERAGVARSTVYVYFESKEELLNQCLARHRLELGERIRDAVDAHDGLEARLTAFLAAILEYVGDIRHLFLAVMALRGLDPFFLGQPGEAVPSELATIRAESQATMLAIFKDAENRGEIPGARVAEAVDVFGTLLYGALVRRAHDPAPPPALGEARKLAGAFLGGVAGRPAV